MILIIQIGFTLLTPVRDIDEKRKISFPRAEVINCLKIKPTIKNYIIII